MNKSVTNRDVNKDMKPVGDLFSALAVFPGWIQDHGDDSLV